MLYYKKTLKGKHMKKLLLLCTFFCLTVFTYGCQEIPSAEEALLKLSINESWLYKAEGIFFMTRQDETEIKTEVKQYTSLQDQKTEFIVDRVIKSITQSKRIDTTYIDDSGHYILQTSYTFNEEMNDYIIGFQVHEYVSKERLENIPVVLPPILPLLQPNFQNIDFSILDASIRKSSNGFIIKIEADFKTLVEIDPELRFLFLNDDDKLRYDITVNKDFEITLIHLYALDPLVSDTSVMSQFDIKVSFLESSYDFPSEAELSEHRGFAGYPDAT